MTFRRLTVTNSRRRFARDEAGGTLAELALLAPLLIALLAGVAEFGRFFQTYTALAKATRSGARYITKVNYTDAEKARARNVVVCRRIDTCSGRTPVVKNLTTANVTIEPDGTADPETVTVRITGYTYQPIFDLGALVGSDTLSLALDVRPSVTMYHMK